MRKFQLREITDRLDRIIEILSDQTYGPVDAVLSCPHEHTEDHGVMGDAPGSKIFCNDCQKYVGETNEIQMDRPGLAG